MRIIFEDRNYVEVKKSDTPGKIDLIISARDAEDPLKKVTNSVTITPEEFKKLIADVV